MRVIDNPPFDANQIRVQARGDAGVHLVQRRAIAGHFTLVELHRNWHGRLVGRLPDSLMNHSGRPFAEFFLQVQCRPVNARCGIEGGGIGFGFQRITGVGQPGQAWQRQQPLRQVGELVGGDADQLQPMTIVHRLRQRLQAVTGKHQLLQVWPLSQRARQRLDAIVGQDQPAQQRWQCRCGHVGDTVGLEADHRQCSALANTRRQLGETVIGAEQHAQTGQAMQVLW
ncbi:hypothetical protein D9M73_168870 [compost metagenome]